MSFQGKIMVGDGSLIVNVDNKSYQVTKEHPMYDKLFDAYRDDDSDTFVSLYDVKQCVEKYVSVDSNQNSTGVVVNGEDIYYNGVKLNNAVVETIRSMMHSGLKFDYMVKFLENAIQSNSMRVVNELFDFLQVCKCTITEDGCFLAYKSVRNDYMDKHSGKFKNEIGAEMRMPKFQVDDNCNNACSHGFHVGALEYAGPGGWYNDSNDKVLIVKVNPADVVSVPRDHSFMKLRTCAYTVVGEFQGVLQSSVYSGKVKDNYSQPKTTDVKLRKLEPSEMVVDGIYKAVYRRSSHVTQRYFLVLEKYDDHVIVELLDPEDCAGATRWFNFEYLEDIYSWNGDYDDLQEDDEDEYDDYEDEYGEYDDYDNYW